ncbi:flavin reductase family protein [Allofournierella sp.]|uniref:flavin reductase family protein n=1 Tax=Allofournierella sp. TaxID=1940256 RepID=UPI002E765491|nr:flavin reductase family protein [Fournierella sp.]MEE0755710.1 flavin reductase family protein [Fournierella sp.]
MSEEKLSWPGSALLGPVPPVLVSCGEGESANLITIAWAGTVCTQPPRVSISVRPTRHSYGLIKESGEFVVNLPTAALARAVDWCGVKSGKDVDKFAAMGLHTALASKVSCPLLAESPVNLECRVFKRIELGSHDLFLADVVAVDVDPALLDSAGKLHLEKAGLLAYAHGDYYALGKQLGKFGWSVRKKKPAPKKTGVRPQTPSSPRRPRK